MKKLLILLIKGYQKFISPMLLPRCIYSPTCSQYMLEAVTKYGATKAVGWASSGSAVAIPSMKGATTQCLKGLRCVAIVWFKEKPEVLKTWIF